MTTTPRFSWPALAALVLQATLSFAQAPSGDAATPAPAPAAPQAVAPVAPPPAGPLKAFREVVRDAKEFPGFFKLWKKDDKVWI